MSPRTRCRSRLNAPLPPRESVLPACPNRSRPAGSFHAFLFKIARHRALDLLRHDQASPLVVVTPPTPSADPRSSLCFPPLKGKTTRPTRPSLAGAASSLGRPIAGSAIPPRLDFGPPTTVCRCVRILPCATSPNARRGAYRRNLCPPRKYLRQIPPRQIDLCQIADCPRALRGPKSLVSLPHAPPSCPPGLPDSPLSVAPSQSILP